jgi:hypothetical protein
MQFIIGKYYTLLYQFFRKNIWITLGIMSLILRSLADLNPPFIEKYYSRGLFPIIRFCFENSLGLFPIAWIYVFYALAFYALFRSFKYLFYKQETVLFRLKNTFIALLSLAGFLLFGFFFLWGFNYARVPMLTQMGIKTQKMDSTALENELKIAATETINARKPLGDTPLPIDTAVIAFEDKIRTDISQFLEKNGFPNSAGLRGRSLKPNGILFGFGISGIYMPYVGESNMDNGLHALEKPFTMAHEMAHGYGWTEEATANFVAYLACTQSQDPYTRYSGHLMYFRYVASNYKRNFPEKYKAFRDTLPPAILYDMKAINDRHNAFKTWFDTEGVNNVFLNWQGVQGGTRSYSRVVTLVYSHRNNL